MPCGTLFENEHQEIYGTFCTEVACDVTVAMCDLHAVLRSNLPDISQHATCHLEQCCPVLMELLHPELLTAKII